MAPIKRNEAKHPKPKCHVDNYVKPKCHVDNYVKPNPLRHSPMAKRIPEKCEDIDIEDELVMHLTEIKNAYTKKHGGKMRTKYCNNTQDPDIIKSKVYNVVSAALECGCVHDVLQKQGNYYCLRNRCVMHTNPGAPRYCQDCCKIHRIVKGPNDFQAKRPFGQQQPGGTKMQVLQCPECRALERTRK